MNPWNGDSLEVALQAALGPFDSNGSQGTQAGTRGLKSFELESGYIGSSIRIMEKKMETTIQGLGFGV